MQHFDLAIIGSGSGNTILDERFDDLSVAMVERNPTFGGTCLNVGCLPTKMFVVPADYAVSPSDAARVGVELDVRGAYFDRIRDRTFSRIDPISRNGAEYRRNASNVTLFTENASFVSPHVLQVGDEQIEADRILIAAGSRAFIPTIDGVDDPDVAPHIHTSDTIMRLSEQPRSLVIVGGGLIAAEFAHIFHGLGTDVTLIHRGDRLLRHEDDDVARQFTDELSPQVALRLNQSVSAFSPGDDGGVVVTTVDREGVEYDYDADAVLLALGRLPNSDTLCLDNAGVAVDQSGLIVVDGQQRTTVDHIWAIGDVCSAWQLKHVANAEARTAQHNLIVDIRGQGEPVTTDHRHVPHAVFSHPQIASVGATQAQLDKSNREYAVSVQKYSDVAYGWALEDQGHFVKLLADPETKQLLGAHIIGPEAANLIQLLVQAMATGIDVPTMARSQYWIHPALTEVVENALLGLTFD